MSNKKENPLWRPKVVTRAFSNWVLFLIWHSYHLKFFGVFPLPQILPKKHGPRIWRSIWTYQIAVFEPEIAIFGVKEVFLKLKNDFWILGPCFLVSIWGKRNTQKNLRWYECQIRKRTHFEEVQVTTFGLQSGISFLFDTHITSNFFVWFPYPKY